MKTRVRQFTTRSVTLSTTRSMTRPAPLSTRRSVTTPSPPMVLTTPSGLGEQLTHMELLQQVLLTLTMPELLTPMESLLPVPWTRMEQEQEQEQ